MGQECKYSTVEEVSGRMEKFEDEVWTAINKIREKQEAHAVASAETKAMLSQVLDQVGFLRTDLSDILKKSLEAQTEVVRSQGRQNEQWQKTGARVFLWAAGAIVVIAGAIKLAELAKL